MAKAPKKPKATKGGALSTGQRKQGSPSQKYQAWKHLTQRK